MAGEGFCSCIARQVETLNAFWWQQGCRKGGTKPKGCTQSSGPSVSHGVPTVQCKCKGGKHGTEIEAGRDRWGGGMQERSISFILSMCPKYYKVLLLLLFDI